MSDERKKLGVVFWGVVLVSLGLLYMLSAPPLQHRILPADLSPLAIDLLSAVYAPARWIIENSPEPVQRAFIWYASLWY
jgi:hypothetical protein